jgi:hypothetical protein
VQQSLSQGDFIHLVRHNHYQCIQNLHLIQFWWTQPNTILKIQVSIIRIKKWFILIPNFYEEHSRFQFQTQKLHFSCFSDEIYIYSYVFQLHLYLYKGWGETWTLLKTWETPEYCSPVSICPVLTLPETWTMLDN